jgi:hypothetical protein
MLSNSTLGVKEASGAPQYFPLCMQSMPMAFKTNGYLFSVAEAHHFFPCVDKWDERIFFFSDVFDVVHFHIL